jgi:hypothetical protein
MGFALPLLGLVALVFEGGVETGLFSARGVEANAITNRNALMSDTNLFMRPTSSNKHPYLPTRTAYRALLSKHSTKGSIRGIELVPASV